MHKSDCSTNILIVLAKAAQVSPRYGEAGNFISIMDASVSALEIKNL